MQGVGQLDRKVFTSKTLDECLRLAASELKIEKQNLNYKIIEKRQGVFRKRVTISVEVEEEKPKENINGSISIKDGKIVVKNPKEGGNPACINPNKEVKVFVNGEEIKNKVEVFESSKIEFFFDENTAERKLDINISPDKMKAYINIYYIPQNIYDIEDSEEVHELTPKLRLKEQIFPPIYTVEEIKEQLRLAGVKFGILESVLEGLTELKNVNNLLVAKGQEPLDATDDILDLKFDKNEDKKLVEDNRGRIDYKSIGYVNTVKKGQVLAVKIDGREGKDGIDVKGGVKRHKIAKRIKLKAGEGCEFKDENTIVASIEGKPSISGNVISVHKVHEVSKDVDIKTGNIDFTGDVIIYGNIKEGMEVRAGHNLIVNKNVEHAKLYSKGDMIVLGNVIGSNLNAGGGDIVKLSKLEVLESLNKNIYNLINTVDGIKKFNLLGKEVHDGEIIKVLIENKFKYIAKLCNDFIMKVAVNGNDEERSIVGKLKETLIGLSPLNIKNVLELDDLTKKIDKYINILQGSLSVPVNIKISYCQDSIITSSGNITITGKGEYVSRITANGSIEFQSYGSLARGGVIKAKDEIRCKSVGSEGGVCTKLIVEEKGHIWVDVAYQNTTFIIGKREYTLEVASKDIHAYLDKDKEIVVDKFVL
ncbi:MAG: DUF342 domain-containing protein [Clostridium thermopalmarium]|nr:DUF342 domain-containing protein [Clostridium thermopalmarium]